MRLFFLILTIILISNFDTTAQNCYELVWSDEFNYEGLPDSTIWSFEEGGSGWGNNELQYYTSKRIENAHVENGFLTIEAREENFGGRNYTSARLITYHNDLSWKYGKIEAKIKLPYGQGLWPAFWMLGDGIFEGNSWPGCGEIDIMEMVGGGEGRDDKVYGTMHYDDNGHASYGGNYQLEEGIFADDFHVFGIEWTNTQIKWFVDGIQYHSASITNDYLTEFHENFFILLNVAVGGDWPGSPNSETVFPQQMVVDYVRVYQLDTEPKINGDTTVIKKQHNTEFKTVESDEFTYNWSVPGDAAITEGQGTNRILVDWGCSEGTVTCELSTNCGEYNLTLPVQTENIQILGNEMVQTYSQNNLYSIPELTGTTYVWEAPDDVIFVGETDTNIVNLTWGNTSGYVKVSISNECGIEYDSMFVDITTQLPYPDPEIKHPIPGTVEAINYDYGGEGVAYHDTDDVNEGPGSRQDEGVDTEPNDGGENIGWIKAGEWVEYSVSVDSTALYDIELRVASQGGGGRMDILMNSESRISDIEIPSTGSWTYFTSIILEDVQLYDTDTLMRLQFNVGDFNISRAIFNYPGTGIADNKELTALTIFPNPTTSEIYVKNQHNTLNYNILDMPGRILKSGMVTPGSCISISEFENGPYLLMLYNKYGSQTLRIFKQEKR